MQALGQRTRFFILITYLASLFVASRLALGVWFPPTTDEGLWFYAGLATLLLGNLLISPFFTKPADAVSSAASGLIALLAVNVLSQEGRESFEEILWVAAVIYLVIILASAGLSIVLRGSSRPILQEAATDFFRVTDTFGAARPVFSVIFFLALITFHRDSAREFGVLFATGAIVVVIQPLEQMALWGARLLRALQGVADATIVGDLLARQEPGIFLVRRKPGAALQPGDLVAVSTSDQEVLLGLHLDWQRLAGETWARIVRLVESVLSEEERTWLRRHTPTAGVVTKLEPGSGPYEKLQRVPLVANKSKLIGIVAPDTDLRTMVFEVTATETDIEEGRLVQTRIGTRNVLYQIIDGISREEVLQQLNRYGYARAKARKVGTWSDDLERFEKVRWIPLVNEPVLLEAEEKSKAEPRAVGHFPGTRYPVIVDVHKLVTHNTAILGILGVGKTILAFELIERMTNGGVRVICLDITGEYASEMNCDFPRAAKEVLGRIGAAGKANYQQNKEEGGSHRAFRDYLKRCLCAFLSGFLNPGPEGQLLILDPSDFEVWQQENNLYSGQAAMSTLTPAQITRIVTELTLELLQNQGRAERARACIVFEEAHTLVPEWNSVASPGDQQATNGTAKAILQGRKYGLGCLLITQRTANVTKSILNQCNTVFAMRVYDATGMEFLRNYIGDDFAGVLSTLEDRHAVVFGRASSCADPVLVRLNDRDQFTAAFRT